MGYSQGETAYAGDEKPAHRVTLTKGFWIGQTPVTQEAYQQVAGNDPSRFKGPRMPVETVSWYEAQSYCQSVNMRLPTEAEWEYAARAGSSGSRYGPLDAISWYSGNSGGQTHDVAQKRPNAWSVFDMLGNVWQWVADWYEENYYSPAAITDPEGPLTGRMRVQRGGSWYENAGVVRVSGRFRADPTIRFSFIGFRCAGE
jgi:formylglycine-generating enzyme required for sulfatase activity